MKRELVLVLDLVSLDRSSINSLFPEALKYPFSLRGFVTSIYRAMTGFISDCRVFFERNFMLYNYWFRYTLGMWTQLELEISLIETKTYYYDSLTTAAKKLSVYSSNQYRVNESGLRNSQSSDAFYSKYADSSPNFTADVNLKHR